MTQRKMEDKGHANLLKDLEDLLDQARKHEFHDFKNKTYAMPKMELNQKLLNLSELVKQGRYDN